MSTNQGATPLVFTSPVAQFRLLLGDTDPTPLDPPVSGQGRYKFYSDDEITGLIALYGGNVKRAAYRGVLSISMSTALQQRSWSTDDLSVRGDLIAESLRKLANDIKAEIDDEEAVIEENLEFSFFQVDPIWNRAEGDTYAWPYAQPVVNDDGGYGNGGYGE